MQKIKKINILVILVIVLSMIVSILSLFYNEGSSSYKFTSIRGEEVTINNSGIYKYDSVSAAVQGQAQDAVTLFLGIPLLIVSLIFANKGSIKWRLALTGTMSYFLYTYVLYTFFANFNQLFLFYTSLMTLTLYSFILLMMSFDIASFPSLFDEKLPVKFIGIYLIVNAAMFGLLWLERIIPAQLKNVPPLGLEHYTTLPVQGMDLGFLIPTAILSGILLLKRTPWGYLLSIVILFKLLTMMNALMAMVIMQNNAGEDTGPMFIIVTVLSLLLFLCLFLMLKHMNENKLSVKTT
ncbi:MAG: hypothetical protein ACM3O3_11670 [Syntrophothermus sp.]